MFQNRLGLALWLEGNLPFLLCFTYVRAISMYKPGGGGGGLYLEGRFNRGFFALRVYKGAYIWRGLYMEGLIIISGILWYFRRL